MRMRGFSIWLACLLFLIQGSVASSSLASDRQATKSSGDSKGSAPQVSIATGKFNQVLVIRLKQGEDLLKGLQNAVAQAGVKNGVFMGAFGSLTSYHVHVVNNTTFPPKNIYMKGKGPYDILSVTGAVIDGRLHEGTGRALGRRISCLHVRRGYPWSFRGRNQPGQVRRLELAMIAHIPEMLDYAWASTGSSCQPAEQQHPHG
jgi:predicted DNA-binding protein with PD1-like motif